MVRVGGQPADPGRRAAGGGDPPRPRGAGRERRLPRGPLLPPQGRRDRAAAAARAARGHPAPGAPLRRGVLPPRGDPGAALLARGAGAPPAPRLSRATCASCRTWSRAPSRSPSPTSTATWSRSLLGSAAVAVRARGARPRHRRARATSSGCSSSSGGNKSAAAQAPRPRPQDVAAQGVLSRFETFSLVMRQNVAQRLRDSSGLPRMRSLAARIDACWSRQNVSAGAPVSGLAGAVDADRN